MKALLAPALGLLLMGCSVSPRPPEVPGVTWQRSTIYIPNQTGRSPRAELRGTRNLQVPYLLKGSDFRYRFAVEVKTPKATYGITCNQTEDNVAPLRCEGDGGLRSLEFVDRCRRGSLKGATGELSIEAWYVKDTYVGFLVREGERPVAAIDMDDTWEHIIWTDGRRADDQLLQIDILTFVIAEIHGAQESGGYPFLCPELEKQRRSPR